MSIHDLIAAGQAPGENYADVLHERARRVEDYKENSARIATSSLRYVTKGTGQITPKDPVMFDVVFTTEPAVLSGLFVSKLPDANHYLYPQVTAGVRDWVTKPNPADHAKDPDDPTRLPFYVGAYLFFVVVAQPLKLPRTDGSNLAGLTTAYTAAQEDAANTFPGTTDHTAALTKLRTLVALMAEAREAIYLKAHAPQVGITHHMTFQQTAIKSLPDNVMSELGDVAPINASYGKAT